MLVGISLLVLSFHLCCTGSFILARIGVAFSWFKILNVQQDGIFLHQLRLVFDVRDSRVQLVVLSTGLSHKAVKSPSTA